MNEQSLYLLTKLSFLKTTIKVAFKTTLNLSVQKFETLDCMSGGISQQNVSLQNSDKGQIFYRSSQTCSRIRRLFSRLVVTMLKKDCPISGFLDLTTKYFLPLLHYTDIVPPSTDLVPPSINNYCPILTHYHQVSIITALYRSSTTKYQQVSPHTDQVPSSINQYCLLLT